MGPFPSLVDKFLYAMIILDHFSSLVAFVPLRAKSDAAKHLKEWLVQFANIAHTTGIVHERTIPYEHHQNGKVEKKNRTLAEASRSMMIRANLPPTFWTYALQHVAWVFNRVLHTNDNITPYEAVIKQKPSLSLLRVFGCMAFVHNMTQQNDLTAKATAVIHLGVAQDSQGCVFFDHAARRFVRGASVIFREDMFPQIDKASEIHLKTIELKNLFDNSLICEMTEQDKCLHLLNMSGMYCIGTPTNYHKAKSTPQAAEWMEACEEELRNLNSMEVWEEVEGVNVTQILGTQWVFALKSDSDGRLIRHKACLVVRGHRQIQGVNFEETFAPTPTFAILQSILTIASKNLWKINTFDVTSAYLHSKIA
ncbi:hypothetical protein O181_066679 [Austropuccinia psidii MF-1]|uniref:Integrase catalytic domain-containing protein n=1 Tax=Austropuccinia psidii MF-1 TaxID=1389203 RepID=A0A9Q3ETG6_9BASI|nr:hypothetical protein [Austropuccinia psidii MF-1]